MIGPAEIEEMMAEFAEKIAWTGAGEPPRQDWPAFVAEAHLDPADMALVGTVEGWMASLPKKP